MIKIIDEKNIPIERRHAIGDNYEDIHSDFMVDNSIVEGLTPFIHNGFMYSPCQLSKINKYAVCEKLSVGEIESERIDYEYTMNITCPYCGYKNIDSWEMPDNSDSEICERCHGEYSYNREVMVEYCSQKIKKGELKEI